MGLVYADKTKKKELGQYYTPADTAQFMASKLTDVMAEGKTLIVKMNAGHSNQNLKLSNRELGETTRAVLPGRSEVEYVALAKSHSNNLTDALPAWEQPST